MLDNVADGRLVSCIVIFFNPGETFFFEAIESVLAQTYSNWELILADDGSTDGSTEMAKRYAERFADKVRYLEHSGHQNRGMSATRNLGIRNAKGEYIAFLDADDAWEPESVARYVQILNAQDAVGMTYGNTLYWWSWTGRPEDLEKDKYDQVVEKLGEIEGPFAPPALLPFFLRIPHGGAVPGICSIMARRAVVMDVGGFEEDFRGLYEDQVFFVKILLRTKVLPVDECLARYRRHADSCLGRAPPEQRYQATLVFLKWLKRYLILQRVKDKEVWKALQEQLRPYRFQRLKVFKRWLRGFLGALYRLPRQIRMSLNSRR